MEEDTEYKIQNLVDNILEYVEAGPIDFSPAIFHDTLYELVRNHILSQQEDK